MRTEIYLAIAERIKKEGMGIKHLDLWNENVIQAVVTQKPFATPAVFVEFETIDWKQAGRRAKHADVYIRIHIITASRGETRDGSITMKQELKCLELAENIASLLPGLSGSCFNSLVHIETVTDHNHGSLVEGIERFKTHVVDRRATDRLNDTQIEAKPVIDK